MGGGEVDGRGGEALRAGAGAGLTENIVALFVEVASIGGGGQGAGRGDPFWDRAMRSLVRNGADLLQLAGRPVGLHALFEVLRTAPTEPALAASPEFRAGSACARLVDEAGARCGGTAARADWEEVRAYWMEQYPAMGDRLRGSVVAMFSTLAEGLMRGRMRELFCGGTSLVPAEALEGRVIVVDFPLKEWDEVGV